MVHLLTGHQIWYNHRHDTRESLWDKVKLVILHGQSVSVPYDQYKKTSLWDYSIDKFGITFSSFYPLLYYCFYSVKKLQYCGKSKVCLSMTLKIESVLYLSNFRWNLGVVHLVPRKEKSNRPHCWLFLRPASGLVFLKWKLFFFNKLIHCLKKKTNKLIYNNVFMHVFKYTLPSYLYILCGWHCGFPC